MSRIWGERCGLHWVRAWGRTDSPLPQGGGLIVDGHDGMPKGWLAVGGAAQKSIRFRRRFIWSREQPRLGPGAVLMCGQTACRVSCEHEVQRQRPFGGRKVWAEVLTMGAGQH